MSKNPTEEHISRRKMLPLIAGSAWAVAHITSLPCDVSAATHLHKLSQLAATSKAPSVFSKQQLDTIAALSETIIPADDHSPGAIAAAVHDFIAEAVSVSSEATKKLWIDGLSAIDELARREFGQRFAECKAEQQVEILDKISRNEQEPSTPEERLFVAAKLATIDGYYRSEIGIHQELEYQGNTALAEFPGCVHEEHKPNGG